MMCDLGVAVKPVLIIDAKATEHNLHRHGIGKMKHIDVAHLWLQDEVKSNRLRVRRVKSEDNFADVGTLAPSNRVIRKHAISMGYVDAQQNLKSGDTMRLWVGKNQSKQIRAVQRSRKRHRSQLVAMPGSEGSRISLRVSKRRLDGHLVVRLHSSGLSRSVSVLHALVSC